MECIERKIPNYQTFEFAEKRSAYCVCVFVINEGEKLLRQLAGMKPICDGLVDIVVADGGSTDNSTEHDKLKPLGVNTLLVKQDKGKLGSQMRMAFDWALDRGYEGVIVADGNGKDGMGAIPRFVEKLKKGMDHVQGSRFIPGGHHENTPLSRLLGLKLLHVPLMRLASGFHYTDTTNGFRAYSAKLLKSDRLQIFRDCFSGYELHYYLAVEAARQGFRCTEIPVSRIYPATGKVPTKISGLKGNFNVIYKLLLACAGFYRPDAKKRLWPCGKKIILSLLWMAAFLILFRAYSNNTLGFDNPDCGNGWLSGDHLIVSHRLTAYAEGKIPFWYKMCYPNSNLRPYTPSVGIQGIIAGVIYKYLSPEKATVAQRVGLVQKFLIGFTVLILMMIVLWTLHEFGFLVSLVAYLSFLLSPWLTPYSRSIYWMPGTFVLPFVVCASTFWNRTLLSWKKIAAASVLLYIAMCLRFSCGFEFLPCVFFSAFIPLTYYAVKYDWGYLRYICRLAAVVIIGLLAFATAILVGILQNMRASNMPFAKALALFLENMMYRTGIGKSEVQPVFFDSFLAPLNEIFHTYFCTRTPLTFNLRFISISCLFFFSLAVFVLIFLRRNRFFYSDLSCKVLALFAAGGVAFCSPVSWLILAKGHAHWHPHIVFVIFLLPAATVMLSAVTYFIVFSVRQLLSAFKANIVRLSIFAACIAFVFLVWFCWESSNFSGYKIIAKYVISHPDFKHEQFYGKVINGKLWIVSCKRHHLGGRFLLHYVPYSGQIVNHDFVWKRAEVPLPFFMPCRVVIKDYNSFTYGKIIFGQCRMGTNHKWERLWTVTHKTPLRLDFVKPWWHCSRQVIVRNCSPEMVNDLRHYFFKTPSGDIARLHKEISRFDLNRQAWYLLSYEPVAVPPLLVSNVTDGKWNRGVQRSNPKVIALDIAKNLLWKLCFKDLAGAILNLPNEGRFIITKVVISQPMVCLHLDRKIANPDKMPEAIVPSMCDVFYLTDHNWIRGYSRHQGGFFVPSAESNQRKYQPGKLVVLPDGSRRKIKKVLKRGSYLNVFTEGAPFVTLVKPADLPVKNP